MTQLATQRLLLIDGHAAAYRFHHGIRSMQTESGTPIQAVFGFIRMVQHLQRQLYPTHLGVVFDGGLPQQRLELVPDYKAHRKPMPDDLRLQLPILQEYLTAACVAWYCLDATEADDVIATFAQEFNNGHVYIGTSDKDMYQLVNETISIIPLAGRWVELDPAGVVTKTGVSPEQIADWLALIGDAADNIPGIPGVGPKTAAKLLAEFNSLEGIYANLENVKSEKLQGLLRQHADIVWRNREMVQLHRVEGLPVMERLQLQPPDIGALELFYEKYGFTSFSQSLRSPELF